MACLCLATGAWRVTCALCLVAGLCGWLVWLVAAQDYRVHRDEIHSKLVAIMRERLLVHLRTLPAVAEGYLRPDEPDGNASNFARALTKVCALCTTLHC